MITSSNVGQIIFCLAGFFSLNPPSWNLVKKHEQQQNPSVFLLKYHILNVFNLSKTNITACCQAGMCG